jgi:hypothetical protein
MFRSGGRENLPFADGLEQKMPPEKTRAAGNEQPFSHIVIIYIIFQLKQVKPYGPLRIPEDGDQHRKVRIVAYLPQRDQDYYDTCPKTRTIPEPVTGPVRIRGEKLARIIGKYLFFN